MGIRTKFNFILLGVLLPALLISGWISWSLLQKQARDEVIHSAELMTEAAKAIRGYTVQEIRPLINQEPHPEFLPQTVPAYAATSALSRFSEEFSDFLYKEATLNPTKFRNSSAMPPSSSSTENARHRPARCSTRRGRLKSKMKPVLPVIRRPLQRLRLSSANMGVQMVLDGR